MEAVGGDQGRHVGTAKVDRAPAAQRPGTAHEDKRFVGAGVLDDLLGLDQGAPDLRAVLRAAGGTGAKSGTAALTAGAVAACGGDDTIFAAHGGEFPGGVGVLHGGEQAPGRGIVPGLLALAAPLADELAERLVEQKEGDAVFAAGIARLFENTHVAEPGDLIEQEENTAAHPPVRL